MAEYLILIYGDEASFEHAGEETLGEIFRAHEEFGAKHAGALRGGHALTPTSTATSIRKDLSGEVSVTDGAFAETKEGLGGFYLVEAEDLDGALAIAKDVPAPFGGVEVRPIRLFD